MTIGRKNKRDGKGKYGVMDENIKEMTLPGRLNLRMR
jgi:hypothetical protein